MPQRQSRRRARPSEPPLPGWRAGRSRSSRPPETGCARRCCAGGAWQSCSGVAAKVARFSLTICHAGRASVIFSACADIGPNARGQILAVLGRRWHRRRTPSPKCDPGKVKIHSAVPPITPRMAGAPRGGATLKCALTMARKSCGTVRSGTRSLATGAAPPTSPRPSRVLEWWLSGNSSARTAAR